MKKQERTTKKIKLEHWQSISLLLILYDILAVNLSYFIALWLRFDGMFSSIPKPYYEAWLHFAPIYTVLCLVVFWFDIYLPPIIANSISYLGNATVFLSMTLLGVGIARSKISSGVKNPRIWIYIAIRMILVPVALFFALKLAGFSYITIMGLCLMAAMPIGNLPLIQCEKMGEATELLSGAIAISTLASIFTITILMTTFTTLLG